jgi:hypothetical protein
MKFARRRVDVAHLGDPDECLHAGEIDLRAQSLTALRSIVLGTNLFLLEAHQYKQEMHFTPRLDHFILRASLAIREIP